MTDGPFSLDFTTLRAAYGDGTLQPETLMAAVLARIAIAGDDHVWIHEATQAEIDARVSALEAVPAGARGRLWGIPFAVKDNIDVAGWPTTAACPAFAYTAEVSARAVSRLLAAGAILVGKTNMDQFATGLVGVRSPYGVARNPFDAAYIPGGSSAGSGVAVGAGLVSFTLGTDTAGSGRVPAAFNNIVGLKPTKGAISTTGLVPACRSLDCISVFALTAADAADVLAVAQAEDATDAFSRHAGAATPLVLPGLRFGVPRAEQLVFCGDAGAEQLYAEAVQRLEAMGGVPVIIDYAPFAETAALLYAGPWVAERLAAIEEFVAQHAADMWPVTRAITEGGARHSAVDTFRALYRLEALRKATAPVWRDIDVMLLPTAPTIWRIAEVEAEPVARNTDLGTYTNFVNLLDLAAIAVPNGFDDHGMPHGVTFVAPAWSDHELTALGEAWQRRTNLPLGATGAAFPTTSPLVPKRDTVLLAVVGAHLSGQPLNVQLTALGAKLVQTTTTAPSYRLYALNGTVPAKPGLIRVAEGGNVIEVEVWELGPEAFGRFTAAIPAPLGIGTLTLADGSEVKGFICEASAIADSADITAFGGWRAYRKFVA